jgi:hypothetical protein
MKMHAKSSKFPASSSDNLCRKLRDYPQSAGFEHSQTKNGLAAGQMFLYQVVAGGQSYNLLHKYLPGSRTVFVKKQAR